MKNYAKVTVINTVIEQGKKDPTKEYLKVLVCQGIDTMVLIVPSVADFDTLTGMVGQETWMELEYKPTYGSMQFSAICDSPQ